MFLIGPGHLSGGTENLICSFIEATFEPSTFAEYLIANINILRQKFYLSTFLIFSWNLQD